MDYLPVGYIQLGMCTQLYYTTYLVTCAFNSRLYKCIRVTKDTIYHVAQIDKSVQSTTASCKKGSFMVCLFSTNFFIKQTYLNGF